MANIFLFRHGSCLNPDYDSEKLSDKGVQQAEEAGKIAGEIINALYLQLNNSPALGELKGVLKVHSGIPRASIFLGAMYNKVTKLYKFGTFGLYGDLIEIVSPKMNRTMEAPNRINQIITQCSPLCGIQFIVGHNPGIAQVVNGYVSEGFAFNGDERLLHMTSEGGGYYINTLEKKVQVINQ